MQSINGGGRDLNGTPIAKNRPYKSPEHRKGLQDRWPQSGFETKAKSKPDDKTHWGDKIATKSTGMVKTERNKDRRNDMDLKESRGKLDENENLGSVENREESRITIETSRRNRKEDNKGLGDVKNHAEQGTTIQDPDKTSQGNVDNLDGIKDDKKFKNQLNGIGNSARGKKDFQRDPQNSHTIRSDVKTNRGLISEPNTESMTNRPDERLFSKKRENIVHDDENGNVIPNGTFKGNHASDRTTGPVRQPTVDAKMSDQPNSSYLKDDLKPRTGVGISFRPFRRHDSEGKGQINNNSSEEADREGKGNLGDSETKSDSPETMRYRKLLYAQPKDYSKNRDEMMPSSLQGMTVPNERKISDRQVYTRQMSDRLINQRNDKLDNNETNEKNTTSPEARTGTQVRRTVGILEGQLDQENFGQSGIVHKCNFNADDGLGNSDGKDVNKLTAGRGNSMMSSDESISGKLKEKDHRHNEEMVISKGKTDHEPDSISHITATSTKKNDGKIDEMDGCGKNTRGETTHGMRFQERGFMLVLSRNPGQARPKVADLVNRTEKEILRQETAKNSQGKCTSSLI